MSVTWMVDGYPAMRMHGQIMYRVKLVSGLNAPPLFHCNFTVLLVNDHVMSNGFVIYREMVREHVKGDMVVMRVEPCECGHDPCRFEV